MSNPINQSEKINGSILIVDDEPSIQRLISRIMNQEKFETRVASNGKEALERLNDTDFDIVISDIVMPIMDGLELAKIVKKQYSADIIIMTGHLGEYSYDQFIDLGASDFLQKPINPIELTLRVKRVLKERHLKEELIQMHKDFAQSQKLESIGQLAAGIAHEINTPIQYIGDNTVFVKDAFEDLTETINLFKELLKAQKENTINAQMIEVMEKKLKDADIDYLSEEVPIAVDQTLEGIERVSNIVRSMKEFSHPGVDEKVMTDIHHSIKNTVTVAKNEWKYVADLTLDFDENMPKVFCNPGEMNQVFLNMIVNASHAIADAINNNDSDKGIIKIQTQKTKHWVIIKISDTGTGIPNDLKDKVFDPFFTTKKIGKGTGQGLAISHTVVVDRHQGKLAIETQQGKGTTFIIKLPVK